MTSHLTLTLWWFFLAWHAAAAARAGGPRGDTCGGGSSSSSSSGTWRRFGIPCAQQDRQQPLAAWPRRRLQQQAAPSPPPAPPAGDAGLMSSLQGIQGDFPTLPPSATGQVPAAAAGGGGAGPAGPAGAAVQPPAADGAADGNGTAAGGPGSCTDPGLLTSTMTTFCKLDYLEQLASISQDAVQACCRLTSATLQRGCWDACSPPPAVSEQVKVVLKIWRNICLISASVTCEEGPPPSG